jgi:uncharacterized membrane protein YfcA
MYDFQSLLVLFAVGAVAGFINVNAGGGSTLTLPTLIFLGLDSSLANGTNRVGILIQNIVAVLKLKKERYSQARLSLKLAAFTIPGVLVGAFFAVKISDETFKTVLGIILIGVIISMLVPRKEIITDNNPDKKIGWKAALALFGIGFYGGFVQAGVGFLIMATLYYLLHFSLIYVNMHKLFIIATYTVPAILIFAFTGNVDWIYGLTLALGNSFGGYWGIRFAVRKGEKFIKAVLLVAVFIMALKLLKIL